MTGKYALIIGNTDYVDSGLAQLTAPGKDTEDFANVLKDKNVCDFDDVKILLNQPSSVLIEAIDEFFDPKQPDDLLILYFSGHGIRDELGTLYLAVRNTNRFRLRSTAIKSEFVREAMDQSRSKRQVLILDCCNSGAFLHGAKAATGISIGTGTAFATGYGRIILTASDSTQFAWEGDKFIGNTGNSLFTHFLIQGLKGKADLNQDGRITVDELFDYVYEQVKLATPKQTPSKFSSKEQGEIILRQNLPVHGRTNTSPSSHIEKRLTAEFSYIAQTAVTARARQTRTAYFYFAAASLLVAATYLSTVFFDFGLVSHSLALMFSVFYFLIAIFGASTITNLARMRAAWYESAIAMDQIKDYAIANDHSLRQVFRWQTSTLPPKYKKNGMSFYLAVEVAVVAGLMFGVGIYFFQQAFFHVSSFNLWISALLDMLTTYLQLEVYKRSLR